jgi:hypothetical protein
MKTRRLDKNSSLILTYLVPLALSLSACGPGMQPYTPPSLGGNTGSSNGPLTWQSLSMDGSPNRGDYKAVQVVTIDKSTKELVVTLPMPMLPNYDGSPLSLNPSQPPGATLTLGLIDTNNLSLTLRVPLKDLMTQLSSSPAAAGLPNGDPLPNVTNGSLPSVTIPLTQLGSISANLYFSLKQVALYVSTPYDPQFSIQIPIQDNTGTRTWGYLTSVPAKTSPSAINGGYLISISIPADIGNVISSNL